MIITSNNEHKKPFNEEILKKEFTSIKSPAKVTSIPSPYAQMHLFNMAFFAANAFIQKNANDINEVRKIYNENIEGEHPCLYDKLISHCLDIHEMLFYWDELNLSQKGFSVKLFTLPEVSTLTEKIKGKEKDKHLNFRITLDLYIDRYTNKLGVTGDTIDCGYYICYNDKIIAVTSPLTGFYISSSADFGVVGIRDLWKDDESIVYLSNDENTYRPLGSREEKFRIFLHKIIENYCPKGYIYFKEYVKEYAKKMKFETKYNNDLSVDLNKYGFSNVPQIDLIKGAIIEPDKKDGKEKKNEENIIAIPDRYNKIYFRSLLDVKKSVSFNLTANDYTKKLDDRMLLGQKIKWLSVNDFFQNDIIELDDAINTDRFYCCKVIDENGNESDVKVLLPLKERFFEFFNYDKNNDEASNQLIERLEVKMVSNDKYVATLKVPTKWGELILSKEYLLPKENVEDKIEKLQSSIVRLADNEDSLYMGVYPFVKDTVNNVNNAFFRVFTYHSKKLSSDLKFYKDTNTGLFAIENTGEERYITSKSYDKGDANFPISTFYALERSYIDFVRNTISYEKNIDFDLMKIYITLGSKNYNAYIIPKFIQKKCTEINGIISIDFGTSNTNVSIGLSGAGGEIKDFDSYVDRNSQIVMLHKPVNACFDFGSTDKGFENQRHFLCEFIPAEIAPNKTYKFAIPSILTSHESMLTEKSVSLVHSNISIDYYINGLRKMDGKTIDNAIPNFKWVEGKKMEKVYAYLYLDQLLIMLRSWLISNNINPVSTKVIYSLPLSMGENDITFYEKVWKLLYQKYFSRNDIDKNLKTISESASPYYAYLKNNDEKINDSLILLDVGGGSTDVLFYQDSNIKATTSYSYAANSLFAGNKTENIFIKEMQIEKSNKQNAENVEENSELSVGDIFNYRFTKKEEEVNTKFRENEKWKFLLLLHSSAIIYHAIQNNKKIIGNDNAKIQQIIFSGNGSKLFKLLSKEGDAKNKRLVDLINKIANHIYDDKDRVDEINVSFVDARWKDKSPKINTAVGIKAATSVGCVCWQLDNNAINEDNSKVIPIGDAVTILQTNANGVLDEKTKSAWVSKGTGSENQEKTILEIGNNFTKFLEGFLGIEGENSLFDYSLTAFGINYNYKEEIDKIIKKTNLVSNSIKKHQLTYPEPAHSIFFVPIQELIIKLSKKFCEL